MPGVRTGRNLSITIDTRNDLLFTMSDNTHFSPASRDKPTSPSCDETRICFLRTNLIPTGGARRDRTDDLLLAKQALSQLSYGPLCWCGGWLAEPELARRNARLRPAGRRRGSLHVACASEGWWAWEDLNFRPHAYQARALTN